MATLPGYYTISEAAVVIGVSHSQCARYVREGILPAVNLGHNKVIEQQAVHQFKRPPRGNPDFRKDDGDDS